MNSQMRCSVAGFKGQAAETARRFGRTFATMPRCLTRKHRLDAVHWRRNRHSRQIVNSRRSTGRQSSPGRVRRLWWIPDYPVQFWLLFVGIFVTRSGASMIWPFVTVILRERLDIPLTTAALLLTIQSVTGLLSTLIVSSLMDRFGRKLPALLGLAGASATLFAMATADSLEQWIILMAISGAALPVFNNGVNTMIADIVPAERRSAAYALIRMIGNAGIAIGPVIGGIVVTVLSFEAVYIAVAGIHALLTLCVLLAIRETIPATTHVAGERSKPAGAGYGAILRDTLFMGMFAMYMLVMLGNTQVFVLLPVYAKEVFGLMESEYSLLLSINAAMVVLLQYAVTRFCDRYRPLHVMGWSALIYAVGLGSVALGYDLPTFSVSMVIVTLGELMLMPTALTFIASIAPIDMRARYLGILGLSWPLAAGIGPVIGGFLSDNFSPVSTWLAASAMALLGALGFALLTKKRKVRNLERQPTMAPR